MNNMKYDMRAFRYFVDMDGVLVDFDKAKYKHKYDFANDEDMWKAIDNHQNWFRHLEPMPDFAKLWSFFEDEKLDDRITILTAIPRKAQLETAAADKREWIKKYIGDHIPVITCYGIEKQKYSGHAHILIDDYARNIGQWIRHGGIGVLHKDAESTITLLKAFESGN